MRCQVWGRLGVTVLVFVDWIVMLSVGFRFVCFNFCESINGRLILAPLVAMM